MSPVLAFKVILLSLVAIIVLALLARRLHLPPAAAMLVGGAAMAFIPGLPPIALDPDLILVVFLPPLLVDGAYFIVWDEFRRNLNGILLLAIGAVVFTTLVVGVVTHWIAPSLPWGVCFALGAIVSPPDAIAAKAVLERVALPRRLMMLLEGESMLNDASGLVLYRFAVAAVLTGTFSVQQALGNFVVLCLGGIAVGVVIGFAVVRLLKRMQDTYLIILASVLPAWISYIIGEAIEVSGVMAAVTYGLILGWHQHEVMSATVRTRGTAFWQVMIFLFESFVFILIGLSLRGVVERVGGSAQALVAFAPAVAAIVAAVLLARFVWVFGIDGLLSLWHRPLRFDWRAATVKSWAGMRGVVTLAVALALPPMLPGRDLILVTAFVVILVTVLVQGSTIGALIRILGFDGSAEHDSRHLTEPQAWARLEAVQFARVSALAYDSQGQLCHPRLLEQYAYRAQVTQLHQNELELPLDVRTAHYDIVLAAVAAGREELLHLHRSGQLHDELLHMLEHDLDLQEITAIHGRGS